MEGDVLRGMARGASDRHGGEDPVLIGRGPLQHLHAAHGAAEHAQHVGNAEMIEQPRLRPHHVGDGDDRELEPVRAPGRRVDRARPGRAHAAADHVRADDEEAIGVDRLARADHDLPPARLAGDRMGVGDMLVAGQRMTDQHEVRLGGVERAVGLIGHGIRRRARRRSRAARPRSAPKWTISLCGLATWASRTEWSRKTSRCRCFAHGCCESSSVNEAVCLDTRQFGVS